MTLVPTLNERLARARTDLRLGLPVVLQQGEEAVLVLAAEGLTEARFASLRAHGGPVLVISARRAETLKARAYDGDLARLEVPGDADFSWVRSVADPQDDLSSPMKGPFRSRREGDASLERIALQLVKSARLLPAVLVVALTAEADADWTRLPAAETARVLASAVHHDRVVSGRVPVEVSSAGRVYVFRPNDGGEDHVVCEIGQPPRSEPALVRLHSACFTGDVLASRKCDCGPQLHAALRAMGEEGAGVLLYLSQEGRGIGLANKLRAYALQDQGFDTVEANHRLGFEDDERDFRTGADLLKRLGFTRVRLMTNNPAKVAMMEAQGIEVVERVPLRVGRREENTAYLDTKARKSGHLL
ncbi:MAG: GTP cyclohydrolase II [Silicimonas sp.]|nr:GTP cyclohydrolase II [Silicimonas sp.]